MRSKIIKLALFLAAGGILLGISLGAYVYISLPDVTILQTRNPKTTALIQLRYRQSQIKGKDLHIQQQWVSFERIPKILKDTIRISEDAGFYQHQGLDLGELKAAAKKNWQKGKFIRGASTITQQLAKNLYLTTDKTITRKIKELFIALSLEKHLKKNRIFHLYLNVIEFGPGVFGVEAAARHYFNKDVSRLGLDEIVRLTAVIPKPLKENPTRNSGWLKWKAGWILDTLLRYKYINQTQHQSAHKSFR